MANQWTLIMLNNNNLINTSSNSTNNQECNNSRIQEDTAMLMKEQGTKVVLLSISLVEWEWTSRLLVK